MSEEESLELLQFIDTLEKEILKPFRCKFDKTISVDFFFTSEIYIYQELIDMFRSSMKNIDKFTYGHIHYHITADKNYEGRYLQRCIEKGLEYDQSIKRYSLKCKAVEYLEEIWDFLKDMENEQEELAKKIIESSKRGVDIKKSEECGELGYGSKVWMIPESGKVDVSCSGVGIGEADYTTNESGKIRVNLKL